MAVTLPPLSLSSGPALSGAPTSSGDASTGDFIINRGATTGEKIALVAPILLIAGLAWLMLRR